MSGLSSATTSSTGTTSTVGTDLAPITFPGIASGIDWTSIINKLTSLTLEPNTQYNSQITQLNAKNAELIKINGLLASVQSSLSALSDPTTFNAYIGTSTDPVDASLSQLPGASPTPGAYTIQATKVASATAISSAPGAGVAVNLNTALISAGTAITPTNGTSGQGLFTVDGVGVTYDVTSQSLASIAANIYTAVHAVDSGFTISVSTNGLVSISSSDHEISLGSAADQGNLEQVLKLDVAHVNNSGLPSNVTSAGNIGGVNEDAVLSSASNAGFATTVTSGSFTINGVQINVDASTENTASVLAAINSSTAGVVASYDLTTGTFSLSNEATGAQSIVVGSSKDTSNFLGAAGLVPGSGAVTSVGAQAYVTLLTPSGTSQTTYSNTDAVPNAIPGMAIDVSGSAPTPFTVTVAQDPSGAIKAITTFVSVYNAAMSEISLATAPPVVQQTSSSATSTTAASSALSSGGVLYGDQTIESIATNLTQFVSSLSNSGNTTYNSLTSIGLSLDTSATVYQSNTDAYGGTVDSTTSGPISSTSVDGTDGQLQQLDITTFTAALAADPTTVAALFTSATASGVAADSQGTTAGLSSQLGSYLTSVTGSPTSLISGLVGTIPAVSLLQNDENTSSAQITSLQQSIKAVTDQANAQADSMRAADTASEALIAQYQSEQTYVNQISGTSSSSS